jgi:hypothetical protein
MSSQIRIVKVNRQSSFDIKKFEEAAKAVLEGVVKPQIKHAAKVKLNKVVVKCNNPV